LQNGGHPKAQASPLSALFFGPFNFAPPSERTDYSEHKSDGSRPAHGFAKQRRHDLMAPLIYQRRGSEKPMSGGSSSWLLCELTLFCDFFGIFMTKLNIHFGIKYADTYMMYESKFTVHTHTPL
jgi:hypothetical protein